jgi:Ca2+-binding RTX toxin-like protein
MISTGKENSIAGDLLELKQEFNSFNNYQNLNDGNKETEEFTSDNDTLILNETSEKVLVRITSGQVEEIIPGLKALGFEVENAKEDFNFIEGYIPIEKLNKNSLNILEQNNLLLGVIPAYEPILNAGSTISQADFVHEADRVRAALPSNYDGSGVKVGVLSDSYNNLNKPLNDNDPLKNKEGADVDIASGDLPAGVTVIEDKSSGGSDEGRAMLQLIHDLAPGAELSFATAFTGESGFANNIRALANNGADVIVDDVIYLAEPFFQDGVIALAVDDVVQNQDVAYFSSAGNNATQSYESDNFGGVADTGLNTALGFNYQSYHDFDPTAGVDTRQQITLQNQENVWLTFQWDDPFYTTGGVDTDLDIYLLNSSGNVVAESSYNNISNQTPFELLYFKNTSGSVQNYDLVIGNYAGPDSGRVKYVNFGSDINPEYATNSSTVYGHAAATDGEAVGAVPFYDRDNPESFTSKGPTTILYEYQTDALGNIINVVRKPNPEVRQTPEIAAIDGGNTTFFGTDIGADADTFPNFFGTSAAAPHAAAIAALLKQANPSLTPNQIYDRLESTAKDISSPGFDNLTGNGLVNAYDAIFGSPVPAKLNFTENFEDKDLPLAFETNSTGAGKIEVTGNNSPSGSYHLTLDGSTLGSVGLNEVILHLDTTDYTSIQFSFDHKEFGDEDHPMSATFTGSENSDGVAFSVDGTNWYRLVNLTDAAGNATEAYRTYTFDLSEIATNNSLTLNSDVQIKFQQYDNFPISTGTSTDGFAFDNISVTGTFDGSNTIEGTPEDDTLNGTELDDDIKGLAGNDSITGLAGNDTIDGGTENDTLNGGLDSDFLKGGEHNDLVFGSSGTDILYGEAGDDTLHGNEDTDLAEGDIGNDSLTGGDGNDTLSGGDGNDTVNGQAHNDSLVGGAGLDSLLGDSGNDKIDGGIDNDTLFGGLDDDSLLGDAGADVLHGGAGKDTIDGGINNDTLNGSTGNDSLFGAGNNDFLLGEDSNDFLSGGNGNDNLNGGNHNDILNGGSGSDTLNGVNGNDSLVGGDDLDRLNGGAGNDTLIGGTGNDILTGSTNNDVFLLQLNSGKDTITDFVNGVDFLGLRGSLNFSNLTLRANGTSTQILDSSSNILAELNNVDVGLIDSSDFVVI